jgi:hypothetical protein
VEGQFDIRLDRAVDSAMTYEILIREPDVVHAVRDFIDNFALQHRHFEFTSSNTQIDFECQVFLCLVDEHRVRERHDQQLLRAKAQPLRPEEVQLHTARQRWFGNAVGDVDVRILIVLVVDVGVVVEEAAV